MFNIQFIVDKEENVYIIEVNPRSSRTVSVYQTAGYSLAEGHYSGVMPGERLERTRHRPDLSGRKETMVRKSTVTLFKGKWNGCLPFSGNEVDRRGDRI